MLSFDVERKLVPCVYEVSYQKGNPPCLILRINKEFLEKNKKRKPSEETISSYKKEFSFKKFSFFENNLFGFDNALGRGKVKGEFVEYIIKLIPFKRKTSNPCKYCYGTGRNKNLHMKCSFCEGEKLETIYDYTPLNAISASFELLTRLIESSEEISNSKKSQLFTFQLGIGYEKASYPIWGSYGIEFCCWLNSFSKGKRFPDVIKAMQEVYEFIYQKEGTSYDFDAYVEENAWLIINCPGEACGIHPEGYSWKKGQGRDFSCHNMDTPVQQIILLTALAVLSDMAQLEIL